MRGVRKSRQRVVIETRNYSQPPTLYQTPVASQEIVPVKHEPQHKPDEEAAQHKRELAAADMERAEALKITYCRLLDAIEAELDGCTDARRITTLISKQASTEKKVHELDHKIEKLYFTANAV